jgi:dienelactone hydrolase
MIDAAVTDFEKTTKNYGGKEKAVYRRGEAGRAVVIMHEIPGLTPKVLGLGKMIADAGYRVALPSLFGQDGKPFDPLYGAQEFAAMCVSAEFNVFAANGSSPVVDWLRELCKDLAAETGGPVGAIGLCITGGFALSLTVGTNGVVRAPVMSEPSLPFSVPIISNVPEAVHLTDAEREEIAAATAPPVMGLRFRGDGHCQKARFDTYEALLKQRFVRIEIPSPDPAWDIKADAHSVLTKDHHSTPADHPTQVAFGRVLAFLKANL